MLPSLHPTLLKSKIRRLLLSYIIMAFPYKHVLLIGATSGIGRAMLNRLMKERVKVIAVGRRQDRLDELVKLHGADKLSSVRYDLADADNAPKFVAE